MIPFPDKKYKIIYADPPWSYWLGGKKNASKHYVCQPIEWIYDLPVKDITDDNCALFLWVTFPLLPEGIETLKRWGFRYVTCAFTWVKKNKNIPNRYFWGCGNYTRANAELCLLGIKGTMKREAKDITQIIETEIEEHSKKPNVVRGNIIQLFGDLPRIERFSRDKIEGWDCWGNEVPKDEQKLLRC